MEIVLKNKIISPVDGEYLLQTASFLSCKEGYGNDRS